MKMRQYNEYLLEEGNTASLEELQLWQNQFSGLIQKVQAGTYHQHLVNHGVKPITNAIDNFSHLSEDDWLGLKIELSLALPGYAKISPGF
jgi:hypothetical protein